MPSILLIDDDRSLLRLWTEALTSAGYSVSCADSASAALAAIRRVPPGLLIVDCRLPDTDGLSLYRCLRQLVPQAPAIMITGYPAVPAAVAALRSGFLDYLAKPITPARLIETVDRALEMSRPSHNEAATARSSVHRASSAETALAALTDDAKALSTSPQRLAVFRAAAISLVLRQDVSVPCLYAVGRLLTAVAGKEAELPATSWVSHHREARHTVRSALRMLEAAESSPGSVMEALLAVALGCHPSHLARAIARDTGLTFVQWRRGIRVRAALRMLLGTDELIAQIAYAMGYEDASHFGRDVKQVCGVSPGVLRQYSRVPASDWISGSPLSTPDESAT